jgi:hypothetical protein
LKQFAEACDRIGVPAPSSTSNGDPGFHRWLEKHIDSDAATWVRHMQRIRSANRTAGSSKAMEARRMPSGRMAYELKYFGASTGRWSGGGGLNLQNLNRKSAEGVDLRRRSSPRPGMSSQLRRLQPDRKPGAALPGRGHRGAGPVPRQPRSRRLRDPRPRTMGYAEPEPLKAYCDRTGSNLRQLAKARVLGLGFGCGWQKFIEVARVMAGLDLDMDESKRIVADFRRIQSPHRRSLVPAAGRLRREGRGHYALPLPCTQHDPALKRYLIYRDVAVRDEQITCTVAGQRMHVYGGLLAENWTQATARDVLASAWLRCASAGFVPS